MKVYTLSKISDPGFELTTTHLDIVYDILSLYVCDMCINEVNDYVTLSLTQTSKEYPEGAS